MAMPQLQPVPPTSSCGARRRPTSSGVLPSDLQTYPSSLSTPKTKTIALAALAALAIRSSPAASSRLPSPWVCATCFELWPQPLGHITARLRPSASLFNLRTADAWHVSLAVSLVESASFATRSSPPVSVSHPQQFASRPHLSLLLLFLHDSYHQHS